MIFEKLSRVVTDEQGNCMIRRALIAGASILAAALAATAAGATTVEIVEVPTNWMPTDYVGSPSGVTVWYVDNLPSGVCQPQQAGNGHLVFTSPSEDEMNRFWAMILTAKTTGHTVFIYYDNVTCAISSFGWQPPG